MPVLLPLKQAPPAPNSIGTSGVLATTEQFEMQAALAYTIALAKQSPVPRGLFAHNLARANALLPVGRQALGIEESQLYFSDTIRGYTTFAYPDRPARVDPTVIGMTRGFGQRAPN